MELQQTSQELLLKRYAGPGETCADDIFKRIAKALAAPEGEKAEYWEPLFLDALRNGCIPAGRIVANAGRMESRHAVSTLNCAVAPVIPDTMNGILEVLRQVGLSLKRGIGVGLNFSTIRPNGAPVSGAEAVTSGVVPFMDIFHTMCKTIASAGDRRGAMMAMLDIRHPDIEEFITAKRTEDRLTTFNLSIQVPDTFMEAVENDDEWELVFPLLPGDVTDDLGMEACRTVYNWPGHIGETTEVKVYKVVKARDLWEKVMRSAYDYAEPGVSFSSAVYRDEWTEHVPLASNPCGEIYLPPDGTCLLGSINLARYVRYPFLPAAGFDFAQLDSDVSVFTRMLDNVVEMDGLPHEAQSKLLRETRRHGMGFMGLGSAMTMLGIRYGDNPECLDFVSEVCARISAEGWVTGGELAEEKGYAPIFADDDAWERFFNNHKGIAAVQDVHDHQLGTIKKHRLRFTHHMAVAPTGTIALTLGNNVSGGIEPSFAHHYERDVKQQDGTTETYDVWSYEALVYRSVHGADAELPKDLFVTADEISPEDHLAVQSRAQLFVDNAISKTINVPTKYPYDEFKGLYSAAHKGGLKGCTVFRPNKHTPGVVLKKKEEAGRPRELTGSTIRVGDPNGVSFYLTINKRDDEPWEVFVNNPNGALFPWVTALTLTLSATLQYADDPAKVINKLAKVFSPEGGWFEGGKYVPSIPAAIGQEIQRLMGHEPEPEPHAETCPACGSGGVCRSEGCLVCYTCGHSKCGG